MHRLFASWVLFASLVIAPSARAVDALLAPPVGQGSIAVELVATEGVSAGVPVVASFGVPFPRGSLSVADLSTLRVTDGGAEIAAFVEPLTPWRHRREPTLDQTSVRVALVQIERTFSGPGQRQTVTVSWGGAPRTLNRPSRALRATTWYTVNDAEFATADGVLEPRVYALLPRAWLSQGVLRGTQALPFENDHPEARDDPAAMDAILTWPGYTEADRALKNDFYTVTNRDDPMVAPANLCPYKTQFEPWLYDRPAAMFTLYFRSGFFTALRSAVRNTEFYRARVNGSGFFTLDPTDNKYSFNESLAYAFWMTGDATFLPEIQRTADAHNGSPHAWTAGLGFWTERMVAFKLMAHTIAWEVDGNATRASGIDAIIAALIAHQNGAGGAIPAAGRIDGGWYHTGDQHGDWDGAAFGGSTWMTALLTDALRRAYVSDGTDGIAHMIRRSGTFLRNALRTEAGAFGTTTAPRYVIEYDGTDFAVEDPLHDEEHALDVAAALAWADYFGALLGLRDAALAAAIENTYDTYDLGVNYWIRPAGPQSGLAAFRVTPWRKWGWQHRTSDGLAWSIGAANAPDAGFLFADGFEPP